MRPQTQESVREVMQNFVAGQRPKLNRRSIEEIRQGYPFHRLIFPEEAILAARVERSIVTSMGSELYPRLAAVVAGDRFNDIHREYNIEGELNDAAWNMADQIVAELREARRGRRGHREPNRPAEVAEISNSRGGRLSQRSVIADLYVSDFQGGPLFVELDTSTQSRYCR
jgi:hypothetical protein